MSRDEMENILTSKGVKPTANRMLVLKELERSTHPVSLADLEKSLYPMDKASIFRVLDLFSEKDIIHAIEDGSRSLKYELCLGKAHHSLSVQHAHFYCEGCGSLECLEDVDLPSINIPEKYKVRSVNLMYKGICSKCNK
ncbi:MAG: transcriptional repressor [Muribaculaceae bacterium]|nr:transcriptional repressor [Muribaculaceae bacterium]